MRVRRNLTMLTWGCLLFAVSCKGFDEQLMYNRAIRLHDEGKVTEAIKLYEHLLKMDPQNKVHPDNAMIMYDLGVAYLDVNDRKNAVMMVSGLKKLKRRDLSDQLQQLVNAQNFIP